MSDLPMRIDALRLLPRLPAVATFWSSKVACRETLMDFAFGA